MADANLMPRPDRSPRLGLAEIPANEGACSRAGNEPVAIGAVRQSGNAILSETDGLQGHANPGRETQRPEGLARWHVQEYNVARRWKPGLALRDGDDGLAGVKGETTGGESHRERGHRLEVHRGESLCGPRA